jgi:acyl carrier protein
MMHLMDQDTVLVRTRAFLQDAFLYMRPGLALGDSDRLLDKGIIDSMGILELIGFLQSEFGVGVRDDDINEDNLGTVADIARYVMSRQAGNGNGDS